MASVTVRRGAHQPGAAARLWTVQVQRRKSVFANPTILARIPHEELEFLFRGYGYEPYFVEGSDPARMHQAMAATLEHCIREIRRIQQEARRSVSEVKRPCWPMVILRSPKGWTGPTNETARRHAEFFQKLIVPAATSEVLRISVQSAGDTLHKDELIAGAWPDTVVDEGALRVNVAALRRELLLHCVHRSDTR